MNAQSVLTDLTGDEFLVSFSCIATPTALCRALRRSKYVTRVEDALTSGDISESMIKSFADHMLKELHAGESFKYDLSIAALAVALERRASGFSQEYLSDLVNL